MAEFTNDKKQPFLKGGKVVEKAFTELLNEEVVWATPKEDQLEHWDCAIVTKVDIKRIKKKMRSDGSYDEHIHWLEIKGITGQSGWLYGEADFFAFEINNFFIVAYKGDLQEFVKENIKKEYVESPELYKLYRRNGRKDLITMVMSYDLIGLENTMMIKKKTKGRILG
jgi:hypothetical protein